MDKESAFTHSYLPTASDGYDGPVYPFGMRRDDRPTIDYNYFSPSNEVSNGFSARGVIRAKCRR
jgi:hypothetical protein